MASYLDTAIDIAREAGALLMSYFGKIDFELKGDFDLVTEADRASERLITERLRSHFPTHSILGEEQGSHQGSSDFQWYVDPLDGTTNFAHGYPIFNATLALQQGDELIAGVIFDPTRPELWTTERGGGAYLNNRRIHVSRADKLEHALVSTGFPSRKRHLNINIHFYHQLAMITHGVRRGGSAALDLAYVACGRLDGFWEFGLNPWDMAAGLLMVEEAGGRTSDMKGGRVHVRAPHILATNTKIHDETVELFGEIFQGEYRYPMPVIATA
jgi:myo-inositol-1(or 4)-monophosphatase